MPHIEVNGKDISFPNGENPEHVRKQHRKIIKEEKKEKKPEFNGMVEGHKDDEKELEERSDKRDFTKGSRFTKSNPATD